MEGDATLGSEAGRRAQSAYRTNSVTGSAVFAGYGPEVGMPAAALPVVRAVFFLLWLFPYHQLHCTSSSPHHNETNDQTQRPVRSGEQETRTAVLTAVSLPVGRPSVVLCEVAPQMDITGSFHMYPDAEQSPWHKDLSLIRRKIGFSFDIAFQYVSAYLR